jgi:hypothetical protein
MFVKRAQPPPPPPRFGKFISTARCKALQSLYCTIRRLFVLFVDYSRTIRTIRRLFADYSYYSSTIRGLFALFADYSYYSSTIRTIRFTILVLSIAAKRLLNRYYLCVAKFGTNQLKSLKVSEDPVYVF